MCKKNEKQVLLTKEEFVVLVEIETQLVLNHVLTKVLTYGIHGKKQLN